MGQLRVLAVTSCTGEKRSKLDNQLMLEDFKDSARLQKRHEQLSQFVYPAGQMYTGVQHLRVMEGVQLLRQFLRTGSCRRSDSVCCLWRYTRRQNYCAL
jgi:hypothetical protein